MQPNQIALQILSHHAAQRRTAEVYSIVQQSIQRQRQNAAVDRDTILGLLSDATVDALGVSTSARSVLLRARCKKHIRTSRGSDAQAVLDGLQNAIANVSEWRPGNQPKRFVLIGCDVRPGRELALFMECETAPEEQWILVSARDFGKVKRRREGRKLRSVARVTLASQRETQTGACTRDEAQS